MVVDSATLHSQLAEVVGIEHVRPAASTDAIEGVQPQFVVEPGSAVEVAQVLQVADESGLCIAPRGGGTKLSWGNASAAIDVILSLRRMDQVLEHAWGDMTATVQAGCTVAALQDVLTQHGQCLALEPLWPETATIGGILATNDSGSLRLRYGSLRDLIIGITIVIPDGTVARSGGKVVKNVAGYDLPKLMTGALGSLGVITEATFRLHPLPASKQLIRVPVASVDAAQALMVKLLDTQLVPTGIQVHTRHATAPSVDIRFEGSSIAVDAQLTQLATLLTAEGVHDVAHGQPELLREQLWAGAEPALVCKTSVQPTQWAHWTHSLERLATALRLQWAMITQAVGVSLVRIEGANEQVLQTALNLLRSEVATLGGSLVVLAAPPAVKARIDVWGVDGDALPLMRRVKERFDPHNILNPGRFVGGI